MLEEDAYSFRNLVCPIKDLHVIDANGKKRKSVVLYSVLKTKIFIDLCQACAGTTLFEWEHCFRAYIEYFCWHTTTFQNRIDVDMHVILREIALEAVTHLMYERTKVSISSPKQDKARYPEE